MTVVIPVRDRPTALARLLAALRADPGTGGLPGGRGGRRLGGRRSRPRRRAGAPARGGPRAGGGPQRRAARRRPPSSSPSSTPTACPRPGWLDRLRPHLADPRLALVAPRIVALAAGDRLAGSPATRRVGSALDMGPSRARVAAAVGGLLRAQRRPAGPPGGARRRASTRRCRWPRTSTWCGGWPAPAGGCATSRPPRWRTSTPSAPAQWLRRRAFYGTGAALLAAAARRARSRRWCSRPGRRSAWALALAGGRRGRAAAVGLLAVTAVRLARRLARARRAAAARLRRGAGRSAGTGGVGADAGPGGDPAPLAAGGGRRAGLPPGPAAGVLASRVADAVARLVAAPARRWDRSAFAAGRRLEDLAYGAGLWWGAMRARRRPGAAPARPPRSCRPQPSPGRVAERTVTAECVGAVRCCRPAYARVPANGGPASRTAEGPMTAT